MQTKTFSVKDGSIKVIDGELLLYGDINLVVAYTNKDTVTNSLKKVHLLPSTLIHKPKTHEELAIQHYKSENPYFFELGIFTGKRPHPVEFWRKVDCFIAGRKSVGGEFHLTKDELAEFCIKYSDGARFTDLIASLTPPIYPTTITVSYEEGKYLWETIKAEY